MATKRHRTEKEVTDEAECSVVASASATSWEKLPEHLETEILGWLPVKYVYQYRSVCKHWNALLSSIDFKNRIWPEAAINKQPWLVLWDGTTNMPCIAFCFYTRTWNTCFSLSFMEKQRSGKFNWRGSAAGVMFVYWSPFDAKKPMALCNPYTRTSFQLPRMSKITTVTNECLVVNDNNGYKVVALGYCRQDGVASLCVEMYDGSQPGWRVAGFFQKKLKWSLVHGDMFFCDGSFYCMGKSMEYNEMGILWFTVPSDGNGTDSRGRPILNPILDAPLPKPYVLRTILLNYGSRVLAPLEAEGKIVIWEFEKDRGCVLTSDSTSSSWKWKEIARMPPTKYHHLKAISWAFSKWFNCILVGDCVCFTPISISSGQPIKALVYNLKESRWIWLPTFSRPSHRNSTLMSMAFQPAANMMEFPQSKSFPAHRLNR